MSENQYFRVIQKRRGAFIVDVNGEVVAPNHAAKLAEAIKQTSEAKSYVYIGLRESDGLYKVGRTDNLERRQSELGVKFIHTIECALYGEQSSSKVESALHMLLKDLEHHVEGEWFRLGKYGQFTALFPIYCRDAASTLDFVARFKEETERVLARYSTNGMTAFAEAIAEFYHNLYMSEIKDRLYWHAVLYSLYEFTEIAEEGQREGKCHYARALFDLVTTFNRLLDE